eukprot:scaffold63490_cov66-Cyclotella_meneghiniana.AAC.5
MEDEDRIGHNKFEPVQRFTKTKRPVASYEMSTEPAGENLIRCDCLVLVTKGHWNHYNSTASSHGLHSIKDGRI